MTENEITAEGAEDFLPGVTKERPKTFAVTLETLDKTEKAGVRSPIRKQLQATKHIMVRQPDWE
jgi:hypothetical protein